MRDDRAVSDVIGFAFLIGIAISGVVLVYAAGIPAIESQQEAVQIENTEQAFLVLDENLNDHYTSREGEKTTEIQLYKSTLSAGEPTTFEIHFNNEGETYSTTTQPIVFTSDNTETQIVYSSGAVIHDSEHGGVVIEEPNIRISDSHLFIKFVNTTTEDSAFGGTSTATIRSTQVGSESMVKFDETYDVDIVITSPRAGIWKQYFEYEHGLTCAYLEQDTIECQVSDSLGGVTIGETVIDYRFDG